MKPADRACLVRRARLAADLAIVVGIAVVVAVAIRAWL